MKHETLRVALTPTLSRKRERGRAEHFIESGECRAAAAKSLLPLAGEGGAKRRMRASLSPYQLYASHSATNGR